MSIVGQCGWPNKWWCGWIDEWTEPQQYCYTIEKTKRPEEDKFLFRWLDEMEQEAEA